MTNKITFFRFSNSHSVEQDIAQIARLANVNGYSSWTSAYESLSSSREKIDELKKKEHRVLTKEELEISEIIDYDLLHKLDSIDKADNDYKILENHIKIPKEENLKFEVIESIYYKVGKEKNLDIKEVFEIQSQHNYNRYCRQKEELKIQNEVTENERIHFEDLEEINIITEKMNNDGWKIKQIEGIQSGKFKTSNGYERGFGYGYGYTEGIIIVWEK